MIIPPWSQMVGSVPTFCLRALGLARSPWGLFYWTVMEILGASFFTNLKAIITFLVVLCVLIKLLKD